MAICLAVLAPVLSRTVRMADRRGQLGKIKPLHLGIRQMKIVAVLWLRSRVGVLFCSLAFLQLLGGHWAVLQMGAWAGMVVSYTQQNGLMCGLSQTFDGEHPCPVCKAIQDGQKHEEKKAPLLTAELKKDYVASWNNFQIIREYTEVSYPGFGEQLQSIVMEPIVPPPRS